MLFYVEAIVFAIAFSIRMSFMAQAKLYADCNFGWLNTLQKTDERKTSFTYQFPSSQKTDEHKTSFTYQFPSSRNLKHSCNVKADYANSILYLRGKRNKDSKEGELTRPSLR